MLSYQHGFHAGNRADVLKHAVLHAILKDLSESNERFFYVETHSARGAYDLTGKQARKNGEADSGVLAFQQEKPPGALKPWFKFYKSRGEKNYPGSPILAQTLLPATSRFMFFEKHPAEYDALRSTLAGDDRIQIKKADGYAGALRLAPRANETMICFVDPSYETDRDIDELAEWAPRALKRWPNAILILWMPLFQDGRELEFGEYLASLEDGVIAGARWPVDPLKETALEGSAMIAYRLPEDHRADCLKIANALQSWWSSRPQI